MLPKISRVSAVEGATAAISANGASGMPLQFLNQPGHDFVDVAHETIVRYFENRGVGIAVDGYDRTRILHARKMLDGAGDAQGYINLRGDDLARLTDLQLVGSDPRIDQGPRAASGAAESVCQSANVAFEIFGAL